MPEILEHAQVAERGLVKTFEADVGDDCDISVLGCGFMVSGERPSPINPPPELGRDTNAILAELGYSNDDISEMRKKGIM